jgi:hypothetical protein
MFKLVALLISVCLCCGNAFAGQCATGKDGKEVCAPPGGSTMVNNLGVVVGGAGDCAKDRLDYYLKAATLNGDSENVRNLFHCYTSLPEAEHEKLSKTQIDSVIAIFRKAGGIYQPALKAMPPELLNKKPDELIMASNMPKPSNQTAFPICAGVAAKHLYLQYQCRTQHLDCQRLRPEEVPTSLLVSGVGIDVESYKRTQSRNVILYDGGGDALRSLRFLKDMVEIPTEACMPIEEIWATKFAGSTTKMRQAFDNLKAEYADNHAKTDTAVNFDRWLRELREVYGIATDEVSLRTAVKEDMYEKFLYDIMLKGCRASGKEIELLDIKRIGRLPEFEVDHSYELLLSTIKSNLKKNQPGLISFCIYQPFREDRDCSGDAHVFVVYGYRKDCAAKGMGCKEYIKTMNSWGSDYEKYFSDGWIDAARLYKYSGRGLLWLE